MTTANTTLVWLVGDDPSPADESKNLIRANAAAWGHRARRHGNRTRVRSKVPLAPGPDSLFNVIGQPCRAAKLEGPVLSKRKCLAEKLDDLVSGRTRPCLPAPSIPKSPIMLEDELFGRQMDHVLVRFHGLAGQRGLEWLKSVASVRDDELVHVAFKALICGLDSTATDIARRRRCAEILPAIRTRLTSSSAEQSQNMIHLIFLLSYQELLVWNNAKAWMMHISGLNAIVQNLGPHAFKGQLELRTLQQIRLFTIPLNIFLRRTSFLETPKWRKVPWSDGATKDLLDHVLDTLAFIPGLLGQSDRVRAGSDTMQNLDRGVTRVVNALNAWGLNRLPQHISLLLSDHISLEDVIERLSNGSLVDSVVAQATVLHLSTWMFLTRLDPIYTALLPWSVNYVVRSILSISEEYSWRQQGMGVLPWTTAIRVALFTNLGDDEGMKSWGRDLCVRLENRYRVRMLSDIIASLPGPDEVLKFDD